MERPAVAVGLFVLLLAPGVDTQPAASGPPGFLSALAGVGADDWRELRAGRTVVRVLESAVGSDVGVFAAARIEVSTDRFVARVQNTAALWRGESVPATGTFSRPARAADLAAFTLPRKDVDALRECRPGNCAVKLTEPEIGRIRAAVARQPAAWRDEVQREFRHIVADRVETYRAGGPGAVPPLKDHAAPTELAAVLSRLAAVTRALTAQFPHIAEYLDRYPRAPLPANATEHIYWLFTTETPRPVLQVTHVVVHPQPEGAPVSAVVASRQVLATHYVNGGQAVTALTRDPGDPSIKYLVYVNRSELDGLTGVFSGIRRFFIERRIRSSARSAIERLKQRIAS